MKLYLDLLVIFVAVFAVLYPLYHSMRFFRTNDLGHSLALMLMSESFGMAVTMCFAIMAFTGVLGVVHWAVTDLMRLSMLAAAIWTSRRLHRSLDRSSDIQ